jgi:hypothetical protein
VDLTSESDPSDELKLRALAPGRGTAVFLRSLGRAAELAPWRPPSKVRRKCGALSKPRLSEREACGETGTGARAVLAALGASC